MSKRGRKKGASGEQSRALLLAIAAEEFAHKGYYETKISTLVQKAGVTQPTFYLYFKCKEAIYQELIDLFSKGLSDLTNKSRLEPGIDFNSLPSRITKGLTGIFTFFSENQNLTRIGFFNSVEAEEIKKQLAIQIKENLISEVDNGYFQTELDMSLIAEILVGTIERLTLTKLFPGIKGPEEIASGIVHLLLNGMLSKRE
ncbi:TetR/AcrR family transcriptional regulator [Neobacillus citreus]|uniref:TetR/AcrR family transcriptional regulator n=1 Tax=Neobacillus citreus TaxID=2833578 RepID=A0A942T511_9BACI|nr:TetR/AcrR family transcriptional regulator [Neobacillus citreus]MCH6267141.1 TetR/AcrR family transcriptional regulator [Neobacillus citreus]